ncbi:MAG TPA: HD domain-containing protein [Vicinamibacterales bacterium]|nr:HD domain-containing protein [Vicinamibacterales bacterium]
MPRLPRLNALTPEADGWGYFLCTYKELRPVRSGEILLFTLQDATGQIPAKLIDDVERFKDEFDAGEFVRVEARATTFQGQTQLAVTHIRRVNPPQDHLQGFREDDCVLSSPRSADEMWAELRAHLQSVRDPDIRVLLNRIVSDHETELREWPAAQSIHHAYRGGLLEHMLKMAEVGRVLARAYEANEDVVFAGTLLHDIGKLQELHYEPGGAVYSRDGNLVGHIGLGLIMVREAINGISGFPPELRSQIEHLIVSHHGTRDHGSPVEPRTVEAFILAMVDELDTRIHQVRRAIREDSTSEEFTAWHKRLGRVFYKGPPA